MEVPTILSVGGLGNILDGLPQERSVCCQGNVLYYMDDDGRWEPVITLLDKSYDPFKEMREKL